MDYKNAEVDIIPPNENNPMQYRLEYYIPLGKNKRKVILTDWIDAWRFNALRYCIINDWAIK